MKEIDDLVSALKVNQKLRSDFAEHKALVIRLNVEFEPHGHASEDFEPVWYLELPEVQYQWKSTQGWKRGKEGLTMRFRSQTFDGVVRQATMFLRETSSD